jgi:hypothetical protein
VDPTRDPARLAAASLDEASAANARGRLRAQGIVPLEPDERIAVMLAPGEHIVAVRRAVSLERRKDVRDPAQGLVADLYVTTSRLICLGQVPVEIAIEDIRDAVVAAGALRLDTGLGRGLEIRTPDPYLLRVEIAAVREATRCASPRRCPLSEPADAAVAPGSDAHRPVGRQEPSR